MNRVIEAWQRINHQWLIPMVSALTRYKRKLWPLRAALLPAFLYISTPKSPTNMRFEQRLRHWRFTKRGRTSLYESGVDTRVLPGRASAFLRSTVTAVCERETHRLRAGLIQMIKADTHRGKHGCFSGDVKAEQVEPQVRLTLGILFPPPWKLSEKFRQARIERWRQEKVGQGTHDWTRYEITSFVPEDALVITFGLLMDGTGQV